MNVALDAEWLEADGLGGFAMGTVAGWRTRRYHGLLTPAVVVPSRRMVLVDGFEAWVEIEGQRTAISTQHYLPDVTYPDGADRLVGFDYTTWPTWTWEVGTGVRVTQQVLLPHERPAAIVRWSVSPAGRNGRLIVRPLISGRDMHALHSENAALNPAAEATGEAVRWKPYSGLPTILSLANGRYTHAPEWYRNFLLREERNRGFECRMDLFSPGELSWEFADGDAVWVLMAEGLAGHVDPGSSKATSVAHELIAAEAERRKSLGGALDRAADAYLVRRGQGKTIIAGYPWFADWGRDTFIALRGLCLGTGRLEDARAILLEWAGLVSEGMLPNRFVEAGDAPEFNSVDASLWYIVAVHDYLEAMAGNRRPVAPEERQPLERATLAILSGYAAGTRYGIRMDSNGLLAAGVPGEQLTWMDAKIGDRVVTPRIGKPVEVQALWINALRIGAALDARWSEVADRAAAAFAPAFWNPAGYLNDVADPIDTAFRPNQLLALGGLPHAVLDPERGRRLLDQVEARLWTPMGLRSLAPEDPAYRPHYEGDPAERDGAYHQGTVWPWLAGPFIEAWVRVRGNTPAARKEARSRFLAPLLQQLARAGLGHMAEIADAEAPFTPRGCPFQAWSMGELLRLDRVVLASRRRSR